MATKPFDLTRTTLAVLSILGLIAVSFLVLQPFLAAAVWVESSTEDVVVLQPGIAGGTDQIDWSRGANHA